MRFRDYREDMGQFGYNVLGCDCHWESMRPSECQELKMFLTKDEDGEVTTPWDRVIPFVNMQKLQREYEKDEELYQDFYQHYAEILKGVHPGYRVIGFHLFYGEIEIIFAQADTRSDEEFSLWISNPEYLDVTFIGPRTRLGFDPVYEISICRSPSKTKIEDCDCLVNEDTGLMRRLILLVLKDKESKARYWNTTIDVEEYADI